jgi:hypothetical protein
VADFNRRFTVAPAQPESAFTPVAGVELELPLSAKHERVVRNDSTVIFKSVILQLPTTRQRMHFVRCRVYVQQFPNGPLGVSYQGRLLARYDADGEPLPSPINKERDGSAQQRSASTNKLSATLHRTAGANSESIVFRPRSQPRARSDGRKTVTSKTVKTTQLSTQRRGHL